MVMTSEWIWGEGGGSNEGNNGGGGVCSWPCFRQNGVDEMEGKSVRRWSGRKREEEEEEKDVYKSRLVISICCG